MKYTVIWQSLAEEQLASIWMDAEDRQAVTSAANEIDKILHSGAESVGESRSGITRILITMPLAVFFDVHEQDRLVYVLTVRYLPVRPL